MAKFTGLRRSNRGAGGDDGGSDGRWQRNRAAYLATARFPMGDDRSFFRLTDAECESILLKNNAEYVQLGYVGPGHLDDRFGKTVQTYGWPCLLNGWSIVPQTSNENRIPAPTPTRYARDIYHRAPTEPFYPTAWRERRHSLQEFLQYQYYTVDQHGHGTNLALQCCESSGNVRIIDIDCRHGEVAELITELAMEVLGKTPFIRYGEDPKLQLIYRVEGEDLGIQKFSIDIGSVDGEDDCDENGKPWNLVEFLGEGSIFTAYGLHWKTGKGFVWPELHPAIAGPENAPVVTKAKLREFTNRIQQIRPIKGGVSNSNPHGGKSTVTEFDRFANGKIWTPKKLSGDFTVDAEGYVVDGGEKWLTAFAWALCAGNAAGLKSLYGIIEEHLVTRAERALGQHRRSSGSLSSPERIARTAKQKLRTAADKWARSLENHERTGRYDTGVIPWTIMEDGSRPVAQRIAGSPRPADGSLDWIPQETCAVEALAESMPKARTSIEKLSAEQIEANRSERALIEDPEVLHRIGYDVSGQVRSGIRAFLNAIPEDLQAVALSDIPLHVLRAPTGAGKTANTAKELTVWCAANPRKKGQGPVLLVVPTHANADELMAKAEAEGMFTGGVWSDEELKELEAIATTCGVKIVRFKGRKAAGCQKLAELEMLSSKGISVSGLCGARVPTVTEAEAEWLRRRDEKVPTEEVLCEYRAAGTCGYYQQFADLQDADIVVVTHAYLTQNQLPKALQEPRAVIIDESVTYSILQARFMPLAAFEAERKMPFITKKEKAEYPGMKAADIAAEIYAERASACKLALATLAKGKEKERDLAAAFLAHPNGRAWIKSAKLVCERSHTADGSINPKLSLEEVADIANRPAADDLLLEQKVWSLIEERMMFVEAGIARGEFDHRFQLIHHVPNKAGDVAPHLRISWRKTPNWDACPTLLLDASADEKIVEKIWGRTPCIVEVSAPMHVRTIASIDQTLSNASFIPPAEATDEQIKSAVDNVRKARALITSTAVIYGYGRVLVGTTLRVREVLTAGGWMPPENVDFVHYGALRGLDFAKHHAAAISLGRSEMPIYLIDAYAAALTFDDVEPELPYDRDGTGCTKEGKPLFREKGKRTIKMRTGQDVSHAVPQMPNKVTKDKFGNKKLTVPGEKTWAQRLEEAWREEEIRQFVGRLRPVFRGIATDAAGDPVYVEPPVWIAVGKILPADIIVDEIVDLDAMLKPAPLYEVARLNSGILSSDIAENDDLARTVLAGRKLGELVKDVLPNPKLDSGMVKRLQSAATIVRHRNPETKITSTSMVFAGWYAEGTDLGVVLAEAAAAVGQTLEIIEVVPAKRKAKVTTLPKLDKYDLSVGGLEGMKRAERELREIWNGMPVDERPSLTETEIRLLRGEEVCGCLLPDEEPA